MKKSTLINHPLSEVIASLGHTDMLVIADAGLPIPPQTRRIDLALSQGIPPFLDTLAVVLSEMYVEGAFVSKEILDFSPQMYQAIQTHLKEVPIETIPHNEFKQMTGSARAIVRTGEFTPYANIVLVAGAWGFNI